MVLQLMLVEFVGYDRTILRGTPREVSRAYKEITEESRPVQAKLSLQSEVRSKEEELSFWVDFLLYLRCWPKAIPFARRRCHSWEKDADSIWANEASSTRLYQYHSGYDGAFYEPLPDETGLENMEPVNKLPL